MTDNSKNVQSPLAAFYQREKEQAGDVCFVQPYSDGKVEELSWAAVGDQVRRMAAHLKSLELPEASRIAILSNNCAHWIMADMAIWMSGHVSVPLYPVLTANSIRQILEHCEAELMFVGKVTDWTSMSAGVPESVSLISLPICPDELNAGSNWNNIIKHTKPIETSPDPEAGNLATIVYTSGTTGKPKGVMHSFHNIAMTGTLTGEMYETGPADRMLSYLPLAHVAERAGVQTNQLYRGFRVYFSDSLETFATDLRRARPTLFFAVPRIWTKLQQRVFEQVPAKKLNRLLSIPLLSRYFRNKLTRALGLDALRIGVSGAAPLSTMVLSWYESLGISITEGYGMSENFAYSHANRVGESIIGSVGTPNPQVDCKISEEGEVLVKSPTTMLGYYKEPEITAETIDSEGYLRTGDKGVIDSKGYLTLTGRVKEMFKTSKGKYVAPAPIEDLLLNSYNIEQVCVTGADLPKPIALVVLAENAIGDKENIKENMQTVSRELEDLLKTTNQQLDKHENIKCLIIVKEPWSVENGMMTPTLKIKREQIEMAHRENFELWSSQNKTVIWA